MAQLIVPPTSEPISVSELKAHLRIAHDTEDALIQSVATAARLVVERRLERGLMRQTWREVVVGVPCEPVALRPGVSAAVLSVLVLLHDGTTVSVGSDAIRLTTGRPDMVAFDLPVDLPTGDIQESQITFQVGATSPDDVPADLKQAVRLLSAHYFENRSIFIDGRYVPVPFTVDTLLAPHREVHL